MPVVSQDRPLTPAGRRVLEVASTLFFERGINSVGVDLIAAEAGVTKKTVYDRFGSKDALIVAYLRARDERWREFLNGRVAEARTPRDRVLATFDALRDWMTERGCSMVNACAEFPDPGHQVHTVATEQKAWLHAYYTELAAGTGAEPPRDLADRLLILHEGATIAFSVAGMANAATIARDTADAVLPR